MIPTRMLAEKIVDRLEPTMNKIIALDSDSDNFEIETGRKHLIARRERMINIVQEEIISAFNSRVLR